MAGPQRISRIDGPRVGLEQQQGCVLHDDGQAQRHQQDVFVLSVAGPVDDQAL
jgi:hypothetical protein